MRRNDADELRQLVRDNLESVLDALYPGWITHKGMGLLTPRVKILTRGKNKGKSGRPTSSFQVHLGGAKRGVWYRHSQDVGGDTIELVVYFLTGATSGKDGYREAFEWVRKFFGIGGRSESREDREAREKRVKEQAEKRQRDQERERQYLAKKKEEKARSSAEIAELCQPIRGTLAEKYLVLRGLPKVDLWPAPQDDHMGFHPSLEYEVLRKYEDRVLIERGPFFPALVFFVRDCFGDVIALQRIFLCPDTGRKITDSDDRIPDAKMGYGSSRGGAIRIGGDGERIGLCEGPETAIGNWALHGFKFPTWSALSTAGIVAFEAPSFVNRIDYFPDGDFAVQDKGTDRIDIPPGTQAAMKGSAKQREVGIRTVVNEPCLHGDNLDLWKEFHEYESR